MIKVHIKNTCLAWKLTNKFERISYFQVWWSCYSDRIWIQNGFWGDGKNIKKAVSIYISLCFWGKNYEIKIDEDDYIAATSFLDFPDSMFWSELWRRYQRPPHLHWLLLKILRFTIIINIKVNIDVIQIQFQFGLIVIFLC